MRPPQEARGTHKFAFAVFERMFPNSPLLSQTIDSQSPFEWLMARREDANYNNARFIEPAENPFFSHVHKSGIRKLCAEYASSNAFAFDPDHALMAYPIMALTYIASMGVRGSSCVSGEAENRGYEAYLTDTFGPLKPLLDMKKLLVL